jgi:hypothetical protein
LKQICGQKGNADNPLGFYVDRDKSVAYQDESTAIEFGGRRILLTKELKRDLDIIKPWLKRGEHFLIVGK